MAKKYFSSFKNSMNINPIKNLNFKSNIYVVTPKDYENLTDEMSKNPEYKNIYNFLIGKKDDEFIKFRAYRTNSNLISTEDVRSCTLLHCINKGNCAPLTLHAYDSKENLENLPRLEPYVKGTNAFIMGSKSEYEFSSLIFDTCEKMINKEKIPVTIFKDLDKYWQASMAYISKTDSIFVCISEIMNPRNFVKNMEELIKIFKTVKLSPTDRIEFIMGNKDKIKQILKMK